MRGGTFGRQRNSLQASCTPVGSSMRAADAHNSSSDIRERTNRCREARGIFSGLSIFSVMLIVERLAAGGKIVVEPNKTLAPYPSRLSIGQMSRRTCFVSRG